MRLVAALLAVIAVAACGSGGQSGQSGEDGQGDRSLVLEARFSPDPLRSGQPATWLLVASNRGTERITLTFPSGKNGDVVLEQSGREAYRWSGGKFFTQAVRPVALEAGGTETFTLEEERLGVGPGRYQLVATLTADPAPAPVRREVSVE